MEKIYTGKTKDVYKKQEGILVFHFKDDVTGADGVVDPGANSVLGQISGKGKMSLELTQHYFKLLERNNIPTHFISADLSRGIMEVKNAQLPGKNLSEFGGLEFICRLKAYGSFLRRYQKYIREKLQQLPYLIEITVKDDEQGDPLINDDTIVALGILDEKQLARCKELTNSAAQVIEQDLLQKELFLVDIKFEFGLINNQVALIDEVSADSMRVMDKNGKFLSHQEIYNAIKAK